MHKIVSLFLLMLCSAPLHSDEILHQAAVETMVKATRYFRSQVATNGGYLWLYQSDFTRRQGEGIASPTTIWVQPPGTPAVGMAFLRAYEATGDTLFLNGAVEAAQALVWGQLSSGGWDYRIDFDPEASKNWHYRRDVEQGDRTTGERRNRTTLDDDNTQSALRLLMRVDQHLDFADADIHRAVLYGLESLLKAQYPNGAWPQRYSEWADPSQFPIKKAHYPATWSRQYPKERYLAHYTFNDNAIADVIATMIEAHKIYGDERWRRAAERGGDFIILAQMPDPQPAWAQQYNLAMEPAWARRFEPPAITGGESFGVMQILLELYLAYGEPRFLAPIPPALAWAKAAQLPDGRMARFYELQTNRPLYFTKEYALTYSDADLPTHYAFKVGNRTDRIESLYQRILKEGRETILAERAQVRPVAAEQIQAIIDTLDPAGRWLEEGRLRNPEDRHAPIVTQVISCRTFNRNLTLLSQYVASQNQP
ncbi:MAG: hypothetical protein F4Y91_20680 [Gemmatimonadetes bacterium]|nr:hypothetical protein [Gemmatimonadota bacterium]MXY84402.1 hypothetical protein [Gemmatimonadota bacterium]MYB71613.1 hypothetical protein [Gemmatimonadota bacterium]